MLGRHSIVHGDIAQFHKIAWRVVLLCVVWQTMASQLLIECCDVADPEMSTCLTPFIVVTLSTVHASAPHYGYGRFSCVCF